MTIGQLALAFNTPILNDRSVYLTTHDLNVNFPRLYVPADFVKLAIDWSVCTRLTANEGYFSRIPSLIPHVIETKPCSLSDKIPSHLQQDRPIRGTALEPPLDSPRSLPAKYNCRVLISLGLRDDEPGVKSIIPRRLRLLLGRRKGTICLLGGAWSQELDGGDPRCDRECLMKTAHRCIRALSFMDLDRSATLSKLCEITYRRPEETVHGKMYPEQEEVTVVYLATIHVPEYSKEEFDLEWDLFVRRCEGLEIGPRLSPAEEVSSGAKEYLPGSESTEKDSGVIELKTDMDTEIFFQHGDDGSTELESQPLVPSISDTQTINQDSSGYDYGEPDDKQTGEKQQSGDSQADTSSSDQGSKVRAVSSEAAPRKEKPDKPVVLLCPQVRAIYSVIPVT